MKKNSFAIGTIAVLLTVFGILWRMHQMKPQPPKASAVDHLLMQSMPDSSGRQQNLAQWKGKPLIVNFWATWCTPCVQETPELSALQAEIASRNIQIVGIGVDSVANIAQFAAKYNITYPLYAGGMSATDLARQFGDKEGGLPFTIMIDRNGQVRKTYLGRLKMDALRRDLAAL